MWTVKQGNSEIAQAVEAFGAVCVTAFEAAKVFEALKVPFEAEKAMPDSRGDLGEGPLYSLEEVLRANAIKGCLAHRQERTFFVPAPTDNFVPAPADKTTSEAPPIGEES